MISKQGSVTAATHREVRRENRRLQARVKALENLLRDVMNDCNIDTYDKIDKELAATEQGGE